MTDSTPKSCADCPSFLNPTEGVGKFKKNIGAPVCGRFGHVLGKAGLKSSQEAKLQEHFAGRCTQYGSPLPPNPLAYNFQVFMPDPQLREQATAPIDLSVGTCAGCKNFIREDVVMNEVGWMSGACAAKGKLILSNRQVAEAKKCEFKRAGSIKTDMGGLHLLPEYAGAFKEPGDLEAAYFENKENFVDPREYTSDRVVTDEEEEAGIRAWRRIEDPDGSGKTVMLPIYRMDFFSEEEQAKIPKTNDDEHPELYIDHFGGVYLAAVAWTELDETPTLWGMAGTGKTELFRHLAWLMCLPFERVSITAASELDEVIGHTEYNPEEGTWWKDGRIPKAWGKPCVLCIDEPNTGPVEVWQAIRPMTDNSKQLVVNDITRDRHTDCYLGLAMNPAWDARNIGALEIADADANRLFHAYVDLPGDKLEREIIKNRVQLDGWKLSSEQINLIMSVAEDLRKLSDDGHLSVTWGIRPQIKVARAMKWFSPIMAYKRAVADFLEKEPREIILDTVRGHVGESK